MDRVGTWMEDKTVREEVTWASCEAKKLDWIEETVRVEPVKVVK